MKNSTTTTAKRDPVPMFNRKGMLTAFIKGIEEKCILSYGEVGQNVIRDVLFPKLNIGLKPHYNSLRCHPTTGEPILGQRMYAKEIIPSAPSSIKNPFVTQRRAAGGGGESTSTKSSDDEEEENQHQVEPEESKSDEDEIPLTEAAQAKLDKDTATYDKKEELYDNKHKILKDLDDQCASMIIEHISVEMWNEIVVNPKCTEWRALPYECKDRTVLFIRLIKFLFSSGNSSDAVDAMTNLFNTKQSVEHPHPSTFFNAVTDAYTALIPLIQDPKIPGMINGLQLQSMVIINGSDKNSATKEGIKAHLLANPNDALLKPGELIAAILKAHQSDLNTDRVSEQSSALAASISVAKPQAKKGTTQKDTASSWVWHKDMPDFSEIPGKIHCSNCRALCKRFYYSHSTEKCRRTAESEQARKQKEKAKLHAKVAAVEDPSHPTAEAYAALSSAYEVMETYMKENHPEAFEA